MKKRSISDIVMVILGIVGLSLGLMGLINSSSQFEMLGLGESNMATPNPIRGLLTSGSLSAVYVGIMYMFGTINKWKNFKQFVVFARLVMATGFFVGVICGTIPGTFIGAAIWEAAGALFIAIALLWDNRSSLKNTKS